MHVGVGDVVFDRVACSVHTIQRIDTKAASLVPGGVMYGFLGCGESCQMRESLDVVMPHSEQRRGGEPRRRSAGANRDVLAHRDADRARRRRQPRRGDQRRPEISGWHKALTWMMSTAARRVEERR